MWLVTDVRPPAMKGLKHAARVSSRLLYRAPARERTGIRSRCRPAYLSAGWRGLLEVRKVLKGRQPIGPLGSTTDSCLRRHAGSSSSSQTVSLQNAVAPTARLSQRCRGCCLRAFRHRSARQQRCHRDRRRVGLSPQGAFTEAGGEPKAGRLGSGLSESSVEPMCADQGDQYPRFPSPSGPTAKDTMRSI